MGNVSYMGSVSRMNPPVTMLGKSCGLLVRVRPSPESDDPGQIIGTWNVERIDSLGGGQFRIVVRRERVPFSYTRVVSGYGGFEEVYWCNMGGNAANCAETWRPMNWLSDRSTRGDMVGRRLEPGDLVEIGNPIAPRAYFVIEVNPFAVSPIGGVNYVTEPGPIVRYVDAAFHDLYIPAPDVSTNPEAAIDLSLTTGFYGDAGFYLEEHDNEGVYVELTRRVYTRPDGTADEELYPEDASLSQGEYWLNGRTFEARLASLNSEIGENLVMIWYITGMRRWTSAATTPVVIRGAGDGYDEESDTDEVYGVSIPSRTDGAWTVFIHRAEGGDYGTGAVEIRFAEQNRAVALLWSGGTVTRLLARIGAGQPMEDVEGFSPVTLSASAADYISIERDGSEVLFGVGGVGVGSVDLGEAVNEKRYGQVSVVAWAAGVIKSTPFVDLEVTAGGYEGGSVALLQSSEISGIEYSRDLSIGDGEVTSITGSRFGTYSADGSARRRNHYEEVSDGVIRVYSESAPDHLTVQLEGETDAGTPPGRAPRPPSNTLNLATPADEDDPEWIASTDADENRWNWHDEIIVMSADGTCPHVEGEEFRGRRGAVLDPREEWTLEVDGYDETGDWSEVDADDIAALPAEGIFGITQSWLDEWNAEVPLCVRISGTYITHHANKQARQVNEMGAAIEAFPELYAADQLASYTTASIAGWMLRLATGPSAFDCFDCLYVRESGLVVGNSRGNLGEYATAITTGGGSLPAWFKDTSTGGFTEGNTVPVGILGATDGIGDYDRLSNEEETVCDCNGALTWTHEDEFVGATLWYFWPHGGPPPSWGFASNHFGTEIVPPSGASNFPDWLDTSFKFQAIGIALPPALRRVMENPEVRAWVPVKFTGISYRQWRIESVRYRSRYSGHSVPMPGDESHQTYINDVLVSSYVTGESVWIHASGFYSPTTTSGAISFDLVAKRRDSRNVYLDFNYAYQTGNWEVDGFEPDEEDLEELDAFCQETIPRDFWKSFGAGLSTGGEIEEGKWKLIDVSAAVRGMLEMRTSVYTEPALYYSRAGVSLGQENGLLSYLQGLAPSISMDYEAANDAWWRVEETVEGSYVEFEGVEIGPMLFGIEPPEGYEDIYIMPQIDRRRMG